MACIAFGAPMLCRAGPSIFTSIGPGEKVVLPAVHSHITRARLSEFARVQGEFPRKLLKHCIIGGSLAGRPAAVASTVILFIEFLLYFALSE